jgi:N-dimethylarginine dimethylaminohydrolase
MLHIQDEFSQLKKVVVCYGEHIPLADEYVADDPQEAKWGWQSWDKSLLLEQQKFFFERLSAYDVELIFPETEQGMDWQMYTRDTAFVLNDTLYYADKRTLKARQGEIEKLKVELSSHDPRMIPISDKIEGGDVLAYKGGCFVGISSRTSQEAVTELQAHCDVKSFYLGDDVMHLDTRLTLLPNNYVLAHLEAFQEQDQVFLNQQFTVIPVTKEEADKLGTNVFIVNPETIFVEASQTRIQQEIKAAGFKVEAVPYTEPIALGGSFRCTTLPLERKS